MLPNKRSGRVLAAAALAAALLAAAPAAQAQNRTSLRGAINPNKGKIGTPMDLKIAFTIDPPAGTVPGTLSELTLQFPPNAKVNANLFPVCSAATINAAKSFRNCPKGSQIGGGRGHADVTAVPVYNADFDVTLFNGSRSGKKITVHVYAIRPVPIYEAFEATLTRTRGRYGYRFVAKLPYSLQEISPGWFAQVRDFNSTIRARRKIRGKTRGFIESSTLCPRSLSVPLAGSFKFLDGTSSSSQTTIRCRR
ncbi:hypothetical protein [Conexibacter arvalis]|uniref:Opacity protein-like surface antigen n=1 Tax=Conexibacter arvalis TaxID=912552 RepID=A0A840IEE1_9ACTN|nr:hypothetical protein [Conexibacter arvalis]MBB4662583.1 opacity protein-like surface antigen [Conexibacter arvalis]